MAVGDITLSTNTLKLTLSATLQKELDGRNASDPVNENRTVKLATGTGTEKGNQEFADYRALSTGASESLDLYGGLTNTFGVTINFNTIRQFYVENTSTASTLIIDGTVANAWVGFLDSAGTITLQPSGANYPSFIALSAPAATGMDVTAATGDVLKFTHGGEDSANLTYRIVIVGEQA